jgi:tetratricopeptide (TPR) repeat protein
VPPAPSVPPIPPVPSTRFRWFAIAVFALALGVRLLHILQIRSAPFFTLLMGDAHAYDAWAQQIAAGDWAGHDVFYQAPLYPYFLGVIYASVGRNLCLVRIAQAVIGSTSCVLLAYAARRVYNDAAGGVAGVLLALWAPAIFFDGLLQKSVLDVFFVSLTVWLVVRVGTAGGRPRAQRSDYAWPWLGLGLTVGALSLTRENALVFVAILLAWALMGPGRLRRAGMFLAGFAIVVAPVAARNSRLGGGFYVTTSQFGPNFYIGNNPRADGTYASLRYGRGAPEYERQDATELAERALGRRLSPAEVSGYWTDQAIDFITSQPIRWLELVGRKFALLWNATEMVDTEGQDTYAEWSWPLRILGPIAHFGVLVPLAVLGVCLGGLTRPTGRSNRVPLDVPFNVPLNVLLALTLGYAASVLLFYVFARYRYPLVPFLVLFAAGGLVSVSRGRGVFLARGVLLTRFRSARAVGSREGAHGMSARLLFAVVLAAAVFANWRLVPRGWMRAVSESNLGVALQDERRYDEAIAHYQRAVAYRPDYAPALNNLATAYRASGRLDDAVAAYHRALDVQPDFPDAQYNLANALLDKGATDEAVSRFETALRSLPDSVDVRNNLGIALASQGRTDDAIVEFQRAIALDPASATAHRNLADLLAAKGDRAGALAQLREAVRADPANGDAHYDLGLALLEAGSPDAAAAEFRAAVERLPASADARNNLGIALGSQGKLDEAILQFRDALRLQPGHADAKKNLAMALAARAGK